jgi:hypothetical protein
MIKIDFQFDTEYGSFSDALYLDDNHSFTEQEIKAMKQERVNNWIAVIETPSSEEVIETPVEDIVE